MDSRSSRTDGPSPPSSETVVVGHVLRPHGLRGEVVVEVLSDVPGRFDPGSELLLVWEGRDPVVRRVAASRRHRGSTLLRFDGVDGREAADELRGASLEVPLAAVPAAPEGTYYVYQLLGCRVRDRRAGELGEVEEVVEDGGGLLLVVGGGGRRVPVPFVASFIESIDIDGGRIELDLPEGLVELCASRS